MDHHLEALIRAYEEANPRTASTLKGLKLATDRIKKYYDPDDEGAYAIFKDIPFWRWDLTRDEHIELCKQTRSNCCFNHMIGLPIKPDTNKRYPMFEYEKILFEDFYATLSGQTDKPEYYRLVIKSTGLGITEFVTRVMAWLAVRNSTYKNQRFAIITGLTQQTADEILDRIYMFFEAFPELDIDKRVGRIILNGVTIAAYPAENVKKLRSYKDFRFIFVDEADFFEPKAQKEIRTVIERYHTKSKPFVWLVSTPNDESGMCYQLMTTPENVRGYRLFTFDYKWGMAEHDAWIFTPEDIEVQKTKADFEREYNLKFGGTKGNLLSDVSIARNVINQEYATKVGFVPYYDIRGLINQTQIVGGRYPPTMIAIDPAFGTTIGASSTGIVVAQWRQGKVELIYGDELIQPEYQNFLEAIAVLITKRNVVKVYVDDWWSHIIKDLKRLIGEYPHYDTYKKDELERMIRAPEGMRICPVNFHKEGDQMTQKLVSMVDNGVFRYMKEQARIHSAFSSAWVTDNKYDKDESSNDDLFDALRMLTKGLEIQNLN